jgi:hypothetical protein
MLFRKLKDSLFLREKAISENAFGLEIEVENYQGQPAPRTWKVIHDGSLRNNGAEFLTPPLQSFKSLPEFRELLMSHNPKLKISERCSLHVHLNFRENTQEHLCNFFLLWLLHERLLFQISGERAGNPYCIRLEDCLEGFDRYFKDLLESTILQRDFTGFRNDEHFKYCGINFCRLSDLGTVEIRIHEGTLSVPRIKKWVVLLLSLKKISKSHTLMGLIQEIQKNPTQWIYLFDEYEIDKELALEDLAKGGYIAGTWLSSPILDTEVVDQEFRLWYDNKVAMRRRTRKRRGDREVWGGPERADLHAVRPRLDGWRNDGFDRGDDR